MSKWGKQTVIKFLGGEIRFRVRNPQGADEFVRDLNEMVERSKDMSPAMEGMYRYIMGSVKRNFDAEGRPQKWAPLAPATLADRARQGFPPGPILQRTRKLVNSLVRPGSPGHVARIGPRSLKYGSALDYFMYHQFGTADMPARVMMLVQKQDRAQLSRILNAYIRTGKVTYGGPTR